MRRIKTGLVLATALVMGLSLFGCGSEEDGGECHYNGG